MSKLATWQEGYASSQDRGKFCSFDYEVIEAHTKALMHQAARFLYFKKGKGIIDIDGVQYKIIPNTLIAITPWEITNVIQVVETMQLIKIVYDYSYLNENLKTNYDSETETGELLRILGSQPALYLDSQQAKEVELILDQLREELGVESTLITPKDRPLTSIYTICKLSELMVLYLRFIQYNNKNDTDINVEDKQKGNEYAILSYIYAHSAEKLTIEKISKVFFMSESSVSKAINDLTGSSFVTVINNIRIEKAMAYLTHTDLTLDEIATLTGFVDASHISKHFSSNAGITPMEYRRIYQKTKIGYSHTNKDIAFAVTDYLYKNYATEKLNAEKVAQEFQVSVAELNRSLLYYNEKSFDNLLNFIRINKAAELLASSDETITAIAIEVGYSNIKTFNLNFYKYEEMNPTEFRKSITFQRSDGSEENHENDNRL